MKRMKCNLSQRFEVVLDSDLIDRVGEELSGIVKPGKVMIVADEAVAGLFGGRVKTSLEAAGFEASVFPFAQGENSKTLKTVEQLAAALSDGLFSKSDLIVGLGGGVAMDLAAMTAMLYYRGTRRAFIPTTLTAAIAAAIGGKIGIDGNGVKNLLGGFRQPVGVYVDTKILSELKRSVFMQGMAEAVKYAFVGDKKLFARLVEGQFDLEDMVAALYPPEIRVRQRR